MYYQFPGYIKGFFQDVTRRYGSNYMTTTRKIRHDEKWISAVIGAFDKKDRKVIF